MIGNQSCAGWLFLCVVYHFFMSVSFAKKSVSR
nr:MAG TPA: hypothetical protein [Caudoviricetes sp.]